MSGFDGSLGAYGFRLAYPRSTSEPLTDLVELDLSNPLVTIRWRHASLVEDREEVTAARVVFGRRGSTLFQVDRDPPSIHFDFATPPVPGALVHPLLTVPISVQARWRGDLTLHAGAFEAPSGSWAIMGARQSGKSALLACLATRGFPVVTDDLVAVKDGQVWAGPRCVDLRPDTAQRFDSAYRLGVVGGRVRYRLPTPAGRARSKLRGFFVLEWNDRGRVTIEPLPTQERLQWLYRQEYIGLVGAPDPNGLLPLLGLPAWRLSRPLDWEAAEEAVDRLLSTVNEPEAADSGL